MPINVEDCNLVAGKSVIWRMHAFVGLLILGVFASTTFFEWSGLVDIWLTSATYNYCLLIIPIFLCLVFHKRKLISEIAPSYSFPGLLAVVLGVALTIGGSTMFVNVVQHLGLVVTLIGCIWMAIGNACASELRFALAYLLFLVPVGEFLVPYLQDWTAKVVVFCLQVTGMPVFLEGRYITIPSGVFEVARACSGINYLLATVAVGSIFSHWNFRSGIRRLIFVLPMIAIPLVANGLRAYGIVMIAHLSGYKYAIGVDHYIYGEVFFAFVITILFALGARFSDRREDIVSGTNQVGLNGVQEDKWISVALGTALVLWGAPSLFNWIDEIEMPGSIVAMPVLMSWQRTDLIGSIDGEKFIGSPRMLIATYSKNSVHSVDLKIAFYERQRPGNEVVNQSNEVFDSQRWRIVAMWRDAVRLRGSNVLANFVQISKGDSGRVLCWWYDFGVFASGDIYRAKGAELLMRVMGEGDSGAIVSVSTSSAGDYQAAVTSLRSFISELPDGSLVQRKY